MAHGFSAVKEQALPAYAERFAAAGCAVAPLDYRHFSDSDGEPRARCFPLAMVEDYRCAIDWAGEQLRLYLTRVGMWGASFSGGLASYVAILDKRLRAVVAQAPSLVNAAEHDSLIPPDAVAAAHSRSAGTKTLIGHTIRHFDVHAEPWLTTVTTEAIDWCDAHLKPQRATVR